MPPWDQVVMPRRFSRRDRKSTRLNSSHGSISYAVFCLKTKKSQPARHRGRARIRLVTGEGRQAARGDQPRRPLRFGAALSGRSARGVYDSVFFFNDTATTEIYTLSLHDALPI